MGKEIASRCIALLLLTLAGSIAAPLAITCAAEGKTSKERLSNKASDNQRVDNCRIPLEQRGSIPRPDCVRDTESSTTATTKQRETEPPAPR
jgi:hypothetical protein